MRSRLFKLGVAFRNPSFMKHYTFLLESQHWDSDRIDRYRFENVKQLLLFANEHSTFWKSYFKENNFFPESLDSLDQLSSLPAINKEDLIVNNINCHTTDGFGKYFLSKSSGTSGVSLSFRKNESWDSFNRASKARGLSWYGIDPHELHGYLWGYNMGFFASLRVGLFDAFVGRFRLFSYSEKSQRKFLRKLRHASYLHGYSSMIYELAKYLNSKDKQLLNLKGIFGTSEKILDHYQGQINSAFGIKAVNEYGAAETGLIGFECPEGTIHVNMEGVIVQEENGEIIVTNIQSLSFPIIRYKLGDYVELEGYRPCACGLNTHTIKSINGRVGKKIYGKSNAYPSLVLYYIFKNYSVKNGVNLNYKAFQNITGELVIKVEQVLNNQERKALTKEALNYFQNDINLVVLDDQNLHEFKGKFVDFVSRVDQH